MKIDDYSQAMALKSRLEAAIPFRVKPKKRLLSMFNEHGVTATGWLEVHSIMYTGDEGGIILNLQPASDQDATVFSTSITHVTFDPAHELASEVVSYQNRRTQKLMLENRKGFAAELIKQGGSSKRRSAKSKGFGN